MFVADPKKPVGGHVRYLDPSLAFESPVMPTVLLSNTMASILEVVRLSLRDHIQVMSHATTWRLSLRKGKGDQRVMKVVASPSRGEIDMCPLNGLLTMQGGH